MISALSLDTKLSEMKQNMYMTVQLPSGGDALLEGVLAPCAHRACTMCALCQVFEQLPQQMVYWERGCRWYLVGSEVLPFPLVGSQRLLSYPLGPWMVTVIFPDGLWIVAVISCWVLDGCSYFLLCPDGYRFPYGPWMVTVISQQLKYLCGACTVRVSCSLLDWDRGDREVRGFFSDG